MPVRPQRYEPGPRATPNGDWLDQPAKAIRRIGVGVDGYPEGRDAVALGAALAEVTGAELMLINVQIDPMVPVPAELSLTRLREHGETMLKQLRSVFALDATVVAETDFSIPRALQ